MKIATTKTTVRALQALLANVDLDEEVGFTRATKKEPVPCWCGCGGTTKSRFCPGHDSKFHGLAKLVARGEANLEKALDRLPHEEARIEFQRHVDLEIPRHETRVADKADKAAKAAVSEDAEVDFYEDVQDEVLVTA